MIRKIVLQLITVFIPYPEVQGDQPSVAVAAALSHAPLRICLVPPVLQPVPLSG